MIEIKHLKTLQALRNCGSLAAAAATLHQTQSALSHQFSDPAAAGQPGSAADRQRAAVL